LSLLKNSALNIAGGIVPALVAIPALAYLARELSAGQLGVLMLIWAVVGYGGVFDAGLGKAVVRHVSMTSERAGLHGSILGTALVFVIIAGTAVATALHAAAGAVVLHVFNVEQEIAHDSAQSVRIAAWCIPLLLVSSILQSYLEGMQRFVAFNIYRTVTGATLYLFPVLALWMWGGFVSAMAGFLVARLTALIHIAVMSARQCPPASWRFDARVLRQLITFGGWLTVTNIVSPFMVYMDRIVIARVVGAGTVAAYTAPADLVVRMSFLPTAVSRALFPRLSALSSNDGADDQSVRRRAYLYMACLTLPIGLVAIVMAQPLMNLWLGDELAQSSAPVFAVLILGFSFNSLAYVPYSSLQALGFSKLTAQVHLAEVVPYLLCLVFVTSHFGMVGAACVWSARMLVDLIVLWQLDRRVRGRK
jgi:O-antigen/teichoic acid export membrane protein